MTSFEKIRYLAALAASVAGALFCVLAAFGMTDAVCSTQGCALFKGAAIYGVNMYWIGAAGFAVFCAALFAGGKVWSRPALFVLLWLALALDAALLAVQVMTVPCMNCLIVATLLGLLGAVVFPLRSKSALVLLVWAFFYVAGLMSLGGEFAGPVPVHGAVDSRVRIFFSPTCPACSDMVVAASKAGILEDAALFPVAKNDEDVRRIIRLEADLVAGKELGEALWTCFNEEAPEEAVMSEASWRIQLLSWRNKAFLARSGATTVPYVFSDALIAATAPPTQAGLSATQTPEAGSEVLPDILPRSKSCDYTADEDCER